MDEEWDDDLEVRRSGIFAMLSLEMFHNHLVWRSCFPGQETGGAVAGGEDFTVTTDSRDPDRIFWCV